jgi:hypothetical protein
VKAQTEPHSLLNVHLGDQIRRVCVILLMGAVMGDGKSTDMQCGRIGSFSRTLHLSRATFTPSKFASDTSRLFCWIKTSVIERVTRAVMFDRQLVQVLNGTSILDTYVRVKSRINISVLQNEGHESPPRSERKHLVVTQ